MTRPPISQVLLTEEQIQARVRELAGAISRDYAARDLLLVTVLKGGVYFLADLTRALEIPVAIDFMAISSYRGGRGSSGAVRLIKDLDEELTGRHVLLVEDIIDTGLTASYLLRALQARDPADLAICTLLDKTARRIVDTLPIRYRGFEVPDEFLVGYGLDHRQYYRNLPYIAVLSPDLLAREPAPL
ncbi:MAG: hypoxanthine phosphoribosyltransferase [Armatimonadota bacterium]|nr:hypoxanthine phosphoribosyltransferase [Armatimonadota bacterium]MDR7485609.1 hypoxanthine phosphoribosyltransferase [Armatimonadota bacterium]MDR7519837.1 hypoxanthine phosphoribosyltransferase [Armatimonadota bacterium]MDR7550874.1 hypoxanthine phosphoribosyltransferase [Armatimonadota bacterium]